MCGTWDVDGLAEVIPADVFDEWFVYFHKFEAWGDDWLQTSYICSVISNLLATKKSEMVDFDYYVPKYEFGVDEKGKTARTGELTIEEQQAMLAAVYG